jgi:hypothetical protein
MRRERARGDTPTVTVQAVPVQATPVMAQAVVATSLPDPQPMISPARTSNPLSIGPPRVAPGSHASPVIASALPTSAEVGVAATFEVEDDFDDPDGASFAASPFPASGAASPYQPSKLTEFLVANELGQFEGQLRALGAVVVPDLRELEEVRAAFFKLLRLFRHPVLLLSLSANLTNLLRARN